jgi:hypothetical protein
MTARRQILEAAENAGWKQITREEGDRPRDQFELDGVVVTVDYKVNDVIRKAWANERFGVEWVINGTSKQRKVVSYLRSGFIR